MAAHLKPFTFILGFLAIAGGVTVTMQPPAPVDESRVPRVVKVHPGFNIQAEIDKLAGYEHPGGTIELDANATYYDVALKLPYTPNREYQNIQIVGRNTRLVSPLETQSPVIWIGVGWDDWDAAKLEGLRFEGLIIEQRSLVNPGSGKGIFIEFTRGAVIKDCEFVDCPYEALYEGGGTSNEQLTVIGCMARGCGRKWSRGPLAAFNLNGFGSTIRDSVAVDCGWGLESGGTELRVIGCRFVDAPCALGSTVYGCSNQILSHCTFERSSITIGNGIGRQSDVRILANTLTDSPLCLVGAAETNKVTLKGLPYHNHLSVFTGNTVIGRSSEWDGQGVRLTEWGTALKIPEWKIQGNTFDCPPNYSVVVQGYVANPITFADNAFPKDVGIAYLYQGPNILPDPTPQLRFARNRVPPDAVFTINSGTKERRITVN